jgi:hypothetical protein
MLLRHPEGFVGSSEEMKKNLASARIESGKLLRRLKQAFVARQVFEKQMRHIDRGVTIRRLIVRILTYFASARVQNVREFCEAWAPTSRRLANALFFGAPIPRGVSEKETPFSVCWKKKIALPAQGLGVGVAEVAG